MYTVSFPHGWHNGQDAWSREARRVRSLAAELAIPLDSETIILSDVRDLQAIRLRLQQANPARTRRTTLPW